jgi:hypothetical protein
VLRGTFKRIQQRARIVNPLNDTTEICPKQPLISRVRRGRPGIARCGGGFRPKSPFPAREWERGSTRVRGPSATIPNGQLPVNIRTLLSAAIEPLAGSADTTFQLGRMRIAAPASSKPSRARHHKNAISIPGARARGSSRRCWRLEQSGCGGRIAASSGRFRSERGAKNEKSGMRSAGKLACCGRAA